MKSSRAFSLSLILVLLCGCTYQVQTSSTPQLDVYSNYTNKVPGKWVMVVEDDQLQKEVHSADLTCSAHDFPVDLRSSFKASSVATFQNLVESLEVFDRAVPSSELGQRGYAGEIVIRGEEIRTHLVYDPGFWSTKADASAELDAGIIVDGPASRLLGSRATGKGSSIGDAGFYCGSTPETLGAASEQAMKDVLGELGERFTNAPQLRQLAGSSAPQPMQNSPHSVPSAVTQRPCTEQEASQKRIAIQNGYSMIPNCQ